jgi:transposase InsO family protein
VRKLMAPHGDRTRGKRKFRATTDSNHTLPIVPNLLERDVSPATPNAVWTSDITYVATDEGWLYLAAIIDLFNRQVVGWSMKPHMRQDLVTDALRMAWFRRRPAPGLILHSDRGSQYCAKEFTGALKAYGMRASMDEIVDWLAFYNHRRLHSTLGYVSPMQFERAWLAAQQRQAA